MIRQHRTPCRPIDIRLQTNPQWVGQPENLLPDRLTNGWQNGGAKQPSEPSGDSPARQKTQVQDGVITGD